MSSASSRSANADSRAIRCPVLTGKQRRHLRALGHDLKPIVQVGKNGIDEGLVAALDQALADHELVKIKIGEGAGLDRNEAADALAKQTRSEVAQVLGYTVLLYRPDPDEPKITLPAGSAATGSEDFDPEETVAEDD
jgi:RNA-binding protein